MEVFLLFYWTGWKMTSEPQFSFEFHISDWLQGGSSLRLNPVWCQRGKYLDVFLLWDKDKSYWIVLCSVLVELKVSISVFLLPADLLCSPTPNSLLRFVNLSPFVSDYWHLAFLFTLRELQYALQTPVLLSTSWTFQTFNKFSSTAPTNSCKTKSLTCILC